MSFLNNIRLYVSVFLDRQTPWHVKLVIAAGIFYLVVPIDFIPDHIPFMGFLDDVTIGTALIVLALRMVPDDIIDRHTKRNK